MISIGDSDWDDSEDDDLVVTRPLSNGTTNLQTKTQTNGATSKAEVEQGIADLFSFEDLQRATIAGNLDVVTKIFKTEGYDVNEPCQSGWTFLMYAAERAHPDVVEYLISQGSEVNFHHNMYYPLMAAFNYQHLDQKKVCSCVKLLLDAGAQMNVHDRYHFTPLMKCAANGYTDALQLMCSSSVDINKQDERGWTALMYAAETNQRAACEILLASRANVYLASFSDSLTCADVAHSCGHQDLYKLLEATINPESVSFKPAVEQTDQGKAEERNYRKTQDLELFLTGKDLGNLIPLFSEHKVTFDMLLTMNQKDLERVGITQMGVQQKLLGAIKGVHGSEFEMPDMSQSLYNLELNFRDCSKVMKIYSKHLKYMTATSDYLLRQLRNSAKIAGERSTNAPEDSGVADNFRIVEAIVTKLKSNVDQIHDELGGYDILEKREEGSSSGRGVGAGWLVLGLGIGVVAAMSATKYHSIIKILVS